MAEFKTESAAPVGDSTISIVRIDPAIWDVMPLASSQEENGRNLTARQWCEEKGLIVAFNVGMYRTDFSTHCGYMKIGDHVNNAEIVKSDYRSAAAFDPIHDSIPSFHIFDLDKSDIPTIQQEYRSVVQNLRLIKRPGENRWPQRDKRWSEAALGEDTKGRVLFIFCQTPYSMHDFNEILLSLPIELVSAQHLEGGPEAQLFLRFGDMELDLVGSFETGFIETDNNIRAWPIPNIIGVRAK